MDCAERSRRPGWSFTHLAVAFGMTSVLVIGMILVAVWILIFGFNLGTFVGCGDDYTCHYGLLLAAVVNA